MEYLNKYPELVKLYKQASEKTQKKIIDKINEQPSDTDGVGYVYGFTKSEDKNTRYNFYMKMGRTSRKDPETRIEEWGGIQVFSIRSIYNKKFERLVHLFFEFANVHRKNKKKPGSFEVEWFKFDKSYNMNKSFIISKVNLINSLIEDMYLSDDDFVLDNEYNRTEIINKTNIVDKCLNTDKIVLLNINTCSKYELEKINGIGDKLLNLIISNRPYKCLDDIKKNKGIGDVKFQNIKKHCVAL